MMEDFSGTTTQSLGTDLTTIAPAPISELRPMVISPKTTA